MAIKLSDKVLNKLIMEALEEISQTSGGSYDPSAFERGSSLFGRKTKSYQPQQMGEFTAEDLLRMLLDDPKLSKIHRSQIESFFADEGNAPTAKSTAKQKTNTEWDLEEIPSANVTALDSEPTVRMSELPPSPQAFAGPNKGRPAAPALKKPGFFSRMKKAVGLEEQIEQIVSQVLQEIEKNKSAKPTSKQPSEKELKDLESHYGEEMRMGIKGKHGHKARMKALSAKK